MDKYAAALPGCPRLGAKRMRGLIEFFHTAEDVWKASDEDIRKSHVLHGNGEAAFLAWRHETNPDAVMEKLIQNHIRCCKWEKTNTRLFLELPLIHRQFFFTEGNIRITKSL